MWVLGLGGIDVDHIKVMFTYMGAGSVGGIDVDHIKVLFTYVGSEA